MFNKIVCTYYSIKIAMGMIQGFRYRPCPRLFGRFKSAVSDCVALTFFQTVGRVIGIVLPVHCSVNILGSVPRSRFTKLSGKLNRVKPGTPSGLEQRLCFTQQRPLLSLSCPLMMTSCDAALRVNRAKLLECSFMMREV